MYFRTLLFASSALPMRNNNQLCPAPCSTLPFRSICPLCSPFFSVSFAIQAWSLEELTG
jgi:hypothetical protein